MGAEGRMPPQAQIRQARRRTAPRSLRQGVCPGLGCGLQPPELGGRSFPASQPRSAAMSFHGSGHSHHPTTPAPLPRLPASPRQQAWHLPPRRGSANVSGASEGTPMGRQVCGNPAQKSSRCWAQEPRAAGQPCFSQPPAPPHPPAPCGWGGRCLPGFRLLPGDAEG